ncbi:hypothetical protein Aduo_008531 [Ancylostoma duodenale]
MPIEECFDSSMHSGQIDDRATIQMAEGRSCSKTDQPRRRHSPDHYHPQDARRSGPLSPQKELTTSSLPMIYCRIEYNCIIYAMYCCRKDKLLVNAGPITFTPPTSITK